MDRAILQHPAVSQVCDFLIECAVNEIAPVKIHALGERIDVDQASIEKARRCPEIVLAGAEENGLAQDVG